MRNSRAWLCALSTCAVALSAAPANAIVAKISPTLSKVSVLTGKAAVKEGARRYKVAQAAGDKAGAAKAISLGAGGVALIIADPPAGTFYDGAFEIHYNPVLFSVEDAGWLGDWGANASLPAPPINPSDWGSGVSITLQDPSGGLTATASNNPTTGVYSVAFDWGSGGHAATTVDPFNFFTLALKANEAVNIEFLGSGESAQPGANLFASSAGIRCSIPDSEVITLCGDESTQSFRVTPIPEPASWTLMILGFGSVGAALRASGAARRKTAVQPA